MGEAISYAKSLGDIPLLIVVLLLVLAFLVWAIAMLNSLNKAIKAVSAACDAKIKELQEREDEKNKEQDDKLAFLQQHYVTKEDMYQQFGGWRTEIGKVSDQILHLTELVTRKGDV